MWYLGKYACFFFMWSPPPCDTEEQDSIFLNHFCCIMYTVSINTKRWHPQCEREREIEISKQYEMWSICLGLHHYYIYLYTCTVTLGSKIVTSTGIQLWSIKDKKGNYSHSNYAVWQCRWRWSVRRNCIVVLFYGWAFTSKWIMSFVFIVWL